MFDALLAADAALLRQIVSWPHPEWLNRVFLLASFVGTGGSIWLAWGLALFLSKRLERSRMVRLLLAIALAHLVVDVLLKPWFGRLRPPLALADLPYIGAVPDSASFPSGHAANAVAGAMVLATGRGNTVGCWIIWTAAAIVGLARVYLGVHYPLDAAAGGIVGLLCGGAALIVPWPERSPHASRRLRAHR